MNSVHLQSVVDARSIEVQNVFTFSIEHKDNPNSLPRTHTSC